jgi:hypothetical protein
VQPPGQLPAQAACATLLLAAAAAATVWAVSLDSILPARQQQQRQQQRTSTLALMRSSASDTSSYLAGSVSCQRQRQPSRSSAQDAWQPLHAIQQVLGVLGGGLLLQVRPQKVLWPMSLTISTTGHPLFEACKAAALLLALLVATCNSQCNAEPSMRSACCMHRVCSFAGALSVL